MSMYFKHSSIPIVVDADTRRVVESTHDYYHVGYVFSVSVWDNQMATCQRDWLPVPNPSPDPYEYTDPFGVTHLMSAATPLHPSAYLLMLVVFIIIFVPLIYNG